MPRHQVAPPNHPTTSCLPLLFLLHFLYFILLLFVNCTVNPSLRADVAHNSRISILLDILALTLLSSICNATPGRFPPRSHCVQSVPGVSISSSGVQSLTCTLNTRIPQLRHPVWLLQSFIPFRSAASLFAIEGSPRAIGLSRGDESFIPEQGVAEGRTTKSHLCCFDMTCYSLCALFRLKLSRQSVGEDLA